MLDLIDPYDVAGEIRLERQVHRGSFLLVEGKNDEKSLYRFIDENECSIVVAGRKSVAVEAIRILDEDGFEGVLCVVDTDYSGAGYTSENLVETGFRDMDLVIYFSPALDVFLRERANRNKIDAFETTRGVSVKDAILGCAIPIGCLRLLSENLSLSLNFRDLDFSFFDHENIKIDEGKLLTAVFNNTARSIDSQDVSERYSTVRRQNHPPHKICSGHDVMTILGLSLMKCIGDVRTSANHRQDPRTWRSEIEMGCRLAFGRDEFQATSLYSGIRAWESQAAGYRILR